LQAYEDGVSYSKFDSEEYPTNGYQADIITASIGDYSNWATNPWAIVASRLVDEGIVVTM
jgi:hypothetical protein